MEFVKFAYDPDFHVGIRIDQHEDAFSIQHAQLASAYAEVCSPSLVFPPVVGTFSPLPSLLLSLLLEGGREGRQGKHLPR